MSSRGVVLSFLVWGSASLCLAATNDADEALKLRPPRNEIPPSFWEQHGALVLVLGICALIGVALVVWYFARPKSVVPLPPGIRARREFEALAGKPADRAILTRTCQVLKSYVAEAFGLPREEMTTSEFCRAMNAQREMDAGAAQEVCRFLQRSDALKFAPGTTPQKFVEEAMRLMEMLEAKRLETIAVQGPRPQARAEEKSKA